MSAPECEIGLVDAWCKRLDDFVDLGRVIAERSLGVGIWRLPGRCRESEELSVSNDSSDCFKGPDDPCESKLTRRPVTSQYFFAGRSDGGASTDRSAPTCAKVSSVETKETVAIAYSQVGRFIFLILSCCSA